MESEDYANASHWNDKSPQGQGPAPAQSITFRAGLLITPGDPRRELNPDIQLARPACYPLHHRGSQSVLVKQCFTQNEYINGALSDRVREGMEKEGNERKGKGREGKGREGKERKGSKHP